MNLRTELIKFAKTFMTQYIESIVDNYLSNYKQINGRSLSQNASIHLFCEFIAIELNNYGLTYNSEIGPQIIYTMTLVKETIWRPIQVVMFGIESTTKLEKHMVGSIAEIIIKHFADKGIKLEFPSLQGWLNKNEVV